ncbi:MAG: DMT family transporter [Chitinophagales bacterium]|nr:DMT family transporter [Chitinophagales bacterium]
MLLNIFFLVLTSVIWGSSFILMKKGLAEFNPIEVAAIRLSVTFFTMLPFFFIAVKRIRKEQVKWLFVVAILGSGLPAILFATSISKIDSSVAGIVNSTVPLFTLVVGVVFFSIKQRLIKIIGVFIGLGGAAILVFYNSDGQVNTNYAYAMLAVLATVCYGFNTNILKTHFNDINPLHLISMMYVVIGIPAMIFLLSSNVSAKFTGEAAVWQAFGAIVILGILGSAFAMFFFVKLLQRTSALFASTVTYLIPIVAVMWGLYDGESIGIVQMIGMLFILSGVYLVNKVSRSQNSPL